MLNETPNAADESLTRDPLISSPALYMRGSRNFRRGGGGGGGGGGGVYLTKKALTFFFNSQLILQKLNG